MEESKKRSLLKEECNCENEISYKIQISKIKTAFFTKKTKRKWLVLVATTRIGSYFESHLIVNFT